MDLPSLNVAITAGKALRDILGALTSLKLDVETISRIHDAMSKLSDVQQALLETQSELMHLQEENYKLRQIIQANNDWEKRKLFYELSNTEGGATVYKSIDDSIPHYACPRCMEKREIQILQDRKVMGGVFGCPACKAVYRVKPEKKFNAHRQRPDYF